MVSSLLTYDMVLLIDMKVCCVAFDSVSNSILPTGLVLDTRDITSSLI